jgi:hypothetical protein
MSFRPSPKILALGLFFLQACASYKHATQPGLDSFSHRDFGSAEQRYTPGADVDSVDQLIYLFDRATVRHTAAEYERSIKDFLLADKLSEIKDYTNLATEMATIITNDRITQYKGEEFEHVLISAYLAMNFAFLGKRDDAIVECRRVNRKLERLRNEGKRNYDLNAFAQYLSGVLYESDGNWNSAYVDYKKTYSINPNLDLIRKDLVRGALDTGNSSDLSKWKREFGVTEEQIREELQAMRKTGSVVLLFQNGFAPEKVNSRVWPELPEYRQRWGRHRAAVLYLNGERVARSEMLYDVEKVAIANLQQKYATYILKRAAGVVVREVVGNEIDRRTNNSGLGTLVKIAMTAASQPDLRSWLTLPANFQVARAEVKPGKYRATLRLENMNGSEEGEKDLGEVEVRRAGSVALLNWRSLND